MTNNRKKALFILGQLNNLDLEWIIQKGKREKIKVDHILIQEGRQIDALYIVLEGTLSVFIESSDNKELARISSGEIVGEISFLDTRPPLATVKAVEESHLLAIPRMQLAGKLQQDMGFASRFYKGISLCLSDRMRGTVRLLEYGRDLEESMIEQQQEDINPSVLENWALAQAKFNWLMQSAIG